MYDEAKGKADIEALSKDGKAHLSHIFRNGLLSIKAANRRENPDLENAIGRFEEEIKKLGL